ncbi:MAG TPA: ABC transporter permease subunit, partial [Dongiaceae bacterium]|nr:ABC transporter permease subunit [Dongiaceae bacterium]
MTAMSDLRQAVNRRSLWQNEFARSIILQILVAALVVAFAAFFVHNTAVNLEKRGIASGFGFLSGTAGFDISITLIPYTLQSTYGRAFLVGLLNTLSVSALGIVFATVIGFVVGVARLSRNFLIAKLAAAYVDIIRNIPLLAQIIFWYFGVLSTLPSVRQSLDLLHLKLVFLNTRGLYMPAPILAPGFWLIPGALLVGIGLAAALFLWARRRQELTGRQFPSVWAGLVLALGLPLLVGTLYGFHVTFSLPVLQGFNFSGG